MRKIVIIGLIVLNVSSCKQNVRDSSLDDTSEYELSPQEWPQKKSISPKVDELLKEWPEYRTLEVSFDAIYNAANKDDLGLTIENMIEGQKALETSEYPKMFNTPQIKSRQKVFKTYVLKVKGDLIYRLDPNESLNEMIQAYNAVRKQMDVIVSSTFDAKLILDEE